MRGARPILGLATILVLLPTGVLAASPSPAASTPAGSPLPGSTGPALVGHEWMLVKYVAEDGGYAGPTAPSPIRFDGSTVSGNTGCNGFQGGYTSTGDAVSIGDLAVTAMACEPVAAQEAAILAALDEISAYRTDTGDLELLDGQGNARLVYRTLEGPTWVPAYPGDMPVPEAVVTLEFADGMAFGQGPCNGYSAPVTVDGASLMIGTLSATEIACPDLEIEQALFDVLTAARSWTIASGDLVLSDEAGAHLMTFVAASAGD
jgi:heat shock protein HslJ